MRKIPKKSVIVSGVAVLFLLVAAGAGAGAYYFGYQKGFSETKIIKIEGLANIETPKDTKGDFNIFWQAWDKLKHNYVDGKSLDDQKLIYGAIRGLTNSLGDPNTSFFTPDEAKKFNQDVVGSFGGIGAEIGMEKGQLVVVAPLKNTPAEKAGLLPKDKIFKINEDATNDLTVDEAVQKIRGEIGTKVTLTIFRDSYDKPKKVEIIRDRIEVPTLEWKMMDNGILHIQLYSFNNNSEHLFYNAVSDGFNRGMKGIILDLRNNPGGYFDIAVDLAGWFLKRGDVVVKQKSADGNIQDFRANGNGSLANLPVVLLINAGSASASEILAGALSADRGVKLVGEKSFGKGTVQDLETLIDGSTIKITIAHWLLPDGKLIDKNGLKPDYEVKMTEEDMKAKRDPQLDKAIEILKQQSAS